MHLSMLDGGSASGEQWGTHSIKLVWNKHEQCLVMKKDSCIKNIIKKKNILAGTHEIDIWLFFDLLKYQFHKVQIYAPRDQQSVAYPLFLSSRNNF